MTDTDYSTPILVSGELRYLPCAIWDGLEGPKPDVPAYFICNGCTLSPDYIRGKRTWPACVIHDYHYNSDLGLDRKEADAIFRRNLKFILKAEGTIGFIAATLAAFYYAVVRKAGRSRYNGTGDPA